MNTMPQRISVLNNRRRPYRFARSCWWHARKHAAGWMLLAILALVGALARATVMVDTLTLERDQARAEVARLKAVKPEPVDYSHLRRLCTRGRS